MQGKQHFFSGFVGSYLTSIFAKQAAHWTTPRCRAHGLTACVAPHLEQMALIGPDGRVVSIWYPQWSGHSIVRPKSPIGWRRFAAQRGHVTSKVSGASACNALAAPAQGDRARTTRGLALSS